jgi:DNA-binding response OmpR family regulator
MELALLVEDDANVARLCTRLLGRAGYDVRAAATAAEAKALLEGTEDYGIAYVDVGLPDGSGLDVAELARRLRPQLPIVVATGALEDVTGPDDVRLQKPFTLDQFTAAIDEAVRRRGSGGPNPADAAS